MEIWIRKKGKNNSAFKNSVTACLKANSRYLRSPWLRSLNEILDILINISPITVSCFPLNMDRKVQVVWSERCRSEPPTSVRSKHIP
jgi:hypothetical protein